MGAGEKGGTRSRFWREGFAPWREIPARPWEAIQWIVIALVVGGVGVWLVPLLSPERVDPWFQTVAAGNLAGFCIVLLADMIAWEGLFKRHAGRTPDKPRDVAYALAFVAVLLQLGFLTKLAFVNPNAQAMVVHAHITSAVPTLILAVYLLCFRLRELEPSVDVVEKKENDDVKNLDGKSDQIKATSTGVPL